MKLKLEGQRFNKWTVLCDDGTRDPGQKVLWKCKCDCGAIGYVAGTDLKMGKSTQCVHCGAVQRGFRHGLSGTRVFRAHHAAKRRCVDKNAQNYKYYGGKGVKYLFDSPEDLLAEIGHPKSKDLTLDRIDPTGHYEAGNVRWCTFHENRTQNRRWCKK